MLFKLEAFGYMSMSVIFAGIRLSNFNFKSRFKVKLAWFIINNDEYYLIGLLQKLIYVCLENYL